MANISQVTIDNSVYTIKDETARAGLSSKQDALIVGTNLDSTPTQGSTYPITSGGVYNVIGDINSILEEVL